MKKVIYVLLAVFLVLGIYVMTDRIVKEHKLKKAIEAKAESERELLQKQIQTPALDTSKTQIQLEFQTSLMHLDSLKLKNEKFINSRNNEINDIKARISVILSKSICSNADIAEAQTLIYQFNSMLNGFDEKIRK